MPPAKKTQAKSQKAEVKDQPVEETPQPVQNADDESSNDEQQVADENENTETQDEQQEEQNEEPVVSGELSYLDPFGGVRGRHVAAKAVLYTDGISGYAGNNLERAYEYNEKLQSNDPATRAAGDESVSEAAQAQRSKDDDRLAKHVKDGHVGE